MARRQELHHVARVRRRVARADGHQHAARVGAPLEETQTIAEKCLRHRGMAAGRGPADAVLLHEPDAEVTDALDDVPAMDGEQGGATVRGDHLLERRGEELEQPRRWVRFRSSSFRSRLSLTIHVASQAVPSSRVTSAV